MNAQGSSRTLAPVGKSAGAPSPSKKKRSGWLARARHALARVLFPFKQHIPLNGVTPAEAVSTFLITMSANAARTSPHWVKMLELGLEDCGVSYDARHEFFEKQPVEDYYFAGCVAMEAARIRGLYAPAEANAILAEIGEQIDTVAQRRDRIISELVFEIMGKIAISQTPTQQKAPYDLVTKVVLQQLGIGRDEVTGTLLRDKAFRHAMGEPLALGFRNWWAAFQDSFVIYIPPEAEPEKIDDDAIPAVKAAAPPAKRPWRPKRATTF